MLDNYYANKFLEFITARVKTLNGTGQCYIGLLDSNKQEPTPSVYPSYQRIQVAITDALAYTNKMGIPSGGVVSNTSAFSSEQCLEEGGWPKFTYFAIYDAKSGGNRIAHDYLRDPGGEPDENGLYPETTLDVKYKQVAVFKVGALQLTLK